jgi:hypothetical protein
MCWGAGVITESKLRVPATLIDAEILKCALFDVDLFVML